MDSFQFLEEWPNRCPAKEISETLSDIIKNKKFCDVGCGGGDLLAYLEHYDYVDSVCGVEFLKDRADIAINRGLTVYFSDFNKFIPPADVYFFWVGINEDSIVRTVLNNNKKAVVVCNRRKQHEDTLPHLPEYTLEKRYFSYKEESSCVASWEREGEWVLAIFTNKEMQ